jgi:mycothiol synthase
MVIRSGTNADYANIAQVSNLAMPEYHITVEQLISREQTLDPKCKLGYFIAESDEQVVGFARYAQWIDVYHPQVFWITVQVHPDYQRQGIGTDLYNTLSDALAQFKPIAFKSSIYDGHQGALVASQKQGFQEYSRRIESLRYLSTFDSTDYFPLIDKLRAEDVHFVPISELVHDEDKAWELYELQWSLELDVPLEETLTQPSVNQWRKSVVDNPMFMKEASFVAMQNDQYMGLTEVFKYGGDYLYIEFTGTRPKYRRRGIATAMKVLGMQWAKDNGFQSMGTTNDIVNTDILAINQKLGFVAKPARLQIEKSLFKK